MSEPLVFGSSFDALIRLGLDRPLTPAAAEALRAAGVDPAKPPLAGYPVTTWLAVLDVLARELFAGEPLDSAYEKLGRLTVRGIRKTAMGQAKGEVNRSIGTERALERLTRTFRVSNNFVETAVETRGPGDLVLSIHVGESFRGAVPRFTPPAFYLGVLSEILEGWGVAGLHLKLLGNVSPGPGYRFEVRFEHT